MLRCISQKSLSGARVNWRDIGYLANGKQRQQQAYEVIEKYRILDSLSPYDPALVSTVCVNLDIPQSDLDIICHAPDLPTFARFVRTTFAKYPEFVIKEGEAVVVRFLLDAFPIELYAHPLPIEQQNGWRHLTQMARLLAVGGPKLRDAVRAKKLEGIKTEPAFAQTLSLHGDPYAAMLALENLSGQQLRNLVNRSFTG